MRNVFSAGTSSRWLAIIAPLLLASCRLVITTDETGHIVSESSTMDCDQAVCAFEITESVTDTFTAVPAQGYRFVRWTGVCTPAPTETCETTVFPLPEKHARFDGDIGLGAEFEPLNSSRTWFADRDGDNFGDPNVPVTSSTQPLGYVINNQDCDDRNPSIKPWSKEVEDGQDNNCNGRIDEGFVEEAYYQDSDGDGFGNPDALQMAMRKPAGHVRNALDCNDELASDNPEAEDLIDGRDNNCNGEIDEHSVTYFRDVDGDGFGDRQHALESLEPRNGYVENDDDCDDNNDQIYPGAIEQFDSVDNDCDGYADEGFSTRTYYRDGDSDGYGDAADSIADIEQPAGYVSNNDDNCPNVANPSQTDSDGDGIGDACDSFNNLDPDNDGINSSTDNCPLDYNPSQADSDGDGIGDACDSVNNLDPDNDGINSSGDNCPNDYNPSQADSDTDGIGDTCDPADNSADDGGDDSGGSCTVSAEEQSMLNAVNAFRAGTRDCGSRGVFAPAPALSWNCELEVAARGHSADMANNNFFSHTGSDGSTLGSRATAAGYNWSSLGENIAAGYSSVSSVMQGWIDSDGHCANLMGSSFTELGAARVDNAASTYRSYWTQVFGRGR